MAAPNFRLTPADVQSALWKRMSEALLEQLEHDRSKLESPTNTETQTASLRARIGLAREYLGMATPSPGRDANAALKRRTPFNDDVGM